MGVSSFHGEIKYPFSNADGETYISSSSSTAHCVSCSSQIARIGDPLWSLNSLGVSVSGLALLSVLSTKDGVEGPWANSWLFSEL